MSLTTFGEVSRLIFGFSRVAVARISGKLISRLCSQKTGSRSKRGLCLNNFLFLARKMNNGLVRNGRNYDNREARNWSGYLSGSSHNHSEKSRLNFLALRGKNELGSKNTLFATSKKNPAYENAVELQIAKNKSRS